MRGTLHTLALLGSWVSGKGIFKSRLKEHGNRTKLSKQLETSSFGRLREMEESDRRLSIGRKMADIKSTKRETMNISSIRQYSIQHMMKIQQNDNGRRKNDRVNHNMLNIADLTDKV